jgi:hypothetical protein
MNCARPGSIVHKRLGVLDHRSIGTMFSIMDMIPTHERSLGERIADYWRWGLRLAARAAIAFGLSTAAAIGLGAAVTDNGFVQIAITILAALGLWIPFFVLLTRVGQFFDRRRNAALENAPVDRRRSSDEAEESWRRLFTLAPAHSKRLAILKRSLDASRHTLGSAVLDPDAHDLCVLIDRRLPELIHRELDGLAPDDRHRGLQISELVSLIEQFARQCSRKLSGDAGTERYETAVLRRRFEAHLSDVSNPL